MGKVESRVTFAKKQAALHIWDRTVAAIFHWNSTGHGKIYLPLTVGCYLLTGFDFSEQAGHDYLDAGEGRSTALFVLVSRYTVIFPLVFLRQTAMGTIRCLRRRSLTSLCA